MAFAPPFSRVFPATFDRRAAAAAAASWWLAGGVAAANCLAAYRPKGKASLALSYNNDAAPGNGFADGTYDAAPGTAPTHAAATGWTFNGTDQYLTTGVRLYPSYTAIIQISAVPSPSSADWSFGAGKTAPSVVLYGLRLTSAVQVLVYWGDNAANFTIANLIGNHAIAGGAYYLNGAPTGTVTATAAYDPTETCYIGCRNLNGSPNSYGEMTTSAFAIYNTTLTAPQVLAISTAMAAL